MANKRIKRNALPADLQFVPPEPSQPDIETITRAVLIGSIVLTGAFIPLWFLRRAHRSRRSKP